MTTTAEPQAGEIVAELQANGMDKAARRIAYLLSLDGDDPSEAPIDRWSLRALADLLAAEPRLAQARIGVGLDGRMHAEWVVAPDGLLVMEFPADGLIRFSGAFDPPDAVSEQPPVSGTLSATETLATVQPLIAQIESL